MAVQIIGQGRVAPKSTSQQFGEAFSRLAQGTSQHLMQEQMRQREDEALKRMGLNISGVSDPELRKQMIASELQGRNQMRKDDYAAFVQGQQDRARHDHERDLLEREYQLKGLQPPKQEKTPLTAQQVPPEVSRMMNEILSQNPQAGADELRIKMDQAGIPPVYSNPYTENRRRQQEAQASATQKEQDSRRSETMPLRKEFADKAKYARQAIDNKKTSLKLLETGKINDPLTVGLASYLPGAVQGKLLSPETQLYKSGLFEEFGVLRNMFPGATRVKEIELLEDKLATLDKSHDAKKAILENGIKKAERDIILAEAAREVDKEKPYLSYLEFENEVQKKAQPKLDALFDDIVKGYENIYFEHAPESNTYVDQNGVIYKNVPKKDLQLLFKEAREKGIELRPM